MLSGVLNSDIAIDVNISTALAELQAKPFETKPRKPIGFIQPEDDDEDK